jgi:hypothetical protein
MRDYFHPGAVIFCAGILLVSASRAQDQADVAPPSNAAILHQMQELQAEVQALRAELATLKQDSAPRPRGIAEIASTTLPSLPASTPEPVVQDATHPALASTPAPPEKPTLAGLLGPTTLSGFVDTYYGYNSNQPVSRTTLYRNFDINSSQFALNMLELVADKSPDAAASRVGYHLALGFGEAVNQMNAGELGFDQYLKEGYLEYLAPVGKGLQINAGKFVTPAGAEVIETKDNWNYSRSLLFALAIPYFHYGASAKYAFNPKFALTGYLVNGWNNSVENNSGKTTGFSAAWTPTSKISLVQNYLVGPEQFNDNSNFRHLFDTVFTYSPNAKLSLMANYDYGQDHPLGVSAHWSGIAGYIKYAPNDKWAFATRGEYFSDNNGATTGVPQNLSEFTVTAQRMIARKIMSRLEFRRDMSDQNVFPYRTSGIEGSNFLPTSSQNTVTLGLVYAFSSADAK